MEKNAQAAKAGRQETEISQSHDETVGCCGFAIEPAVDSKEPQTELSAAEGHPLKSRQLELPLGDGSPEKQTRYPKVCDNYLVRSTASPRIRFSELGSDGTAKKKSLLCPSALHQEESEE